LTAALSCEVQEKWTGRQISENLMTIKRGNYWLKNADSIDFWYKKGAIFKAPF